MKKTKRSLKKTLLLVLMFVLILGSTVATCLGFSEDNIYMEYGEEYSCNNRVQT